MPRILIVDDYPPVRRQHRQMLEQAGHLVTEAADGVAAFESFNAWPPDLLLTDWHMPAMNGLDLVLALRRLGHELPIILLSGGSTYLHGYLDEVVVLRKPVAPPRLLGMVEALLCGRSAAQPPC